MRLSSCILWILLFLMCGCWLYAQETPRYEHVYPAHIHPPFKNMQRTREYNYNILNEDANQDLLTARNYQYSNISINLFDRQPSCELIELLSRQTGLETLNLRGETQSGANTVLSALQRPLTLSSLYAVLPGIDSMRSQLMRVARVRIFGIYSLEERPVPAWILEMPSLRYLRTNKCHTLNEAGAARIDTYATVNCDDSTDYAATSQQVIDKYWARGVRVSDSYRETGRPNVSVDTVAFVSKKLTVTLRDPTVNEIVSGLIAKGMMKDSTYVYQKGKEYHYNVVRCTDDGVLLVAGKYKYSGTLRDRFLINIEYSDSLRTARKE